MSSVTLSSDKRTRYQLNQTVGSHNLSNHRMRRLKWLRIIPYLGQLRHAGGLRRGLYWLRDFCA